MSGQSLGRLLLVVSIVACTNTKGAPVRAKAATSADSADQVFHGVQAPFETNGIKRGTLYADTMYVMNDQTRFDFLNGRVEFNTEYGKPDGTMSADRGRYDQRTQILEGWGHVVVKSVDGRSLKSPHVILNQYRNEVSSDTTFELIADGKVTTGVGFKTDLKLTSKTCLALCNVRGAVTIPK